MAKNFPGVYGRGHLKHSPQKKKMLCVKVFLKILKYSYEEISDGA